MPNESGMEYGGHFGSQRANKSEETACSAAEPPLCIDEIDEENINRWFDYWILQDQIGRRSKSPAAHTIEKIRRVALAGSRKSRRNAKADVRKCFFCGVNVPANCRHYCSDLRSTAHDCSNSLQKESKSAVSMAVAEELEQLAMKIRNSHE